MRMRSVEGICRGERWERGNGMREAISAKSNKSRIKDGGGGGSSYSVRKGKYRM